MEIEYEGKCYILLRTNVIHPIAHLRHDLLWYPESGMSLIDQISYQPYVKSVVTENPWIIGCYDREDARVWRNGEWRCPNHQTYGASISGIYMTVLKISQSISGIPLDGCKSIQQFKEEIEQQYKTIKRK